MKNIDSINDKKILKLLNQYSRIVHRLHKLGVIKTANVTGGYAEYFIAKKLSLRRNQYSNKKGYDAIDSHGKKYEIKSRKSWPWNEPKIYHIGKSKADFIICIEFEDDWEPRFLLKIPRNNIKKDTLSVNDKWIKKFNIL